ncbi:MAG: hypothetical protein ABIZ64_08825 [Casimicrobium sp.]
MIIALGFSSAFATTLPAELPQQQGADSIEWERILPVAQNLKADGAAAAASRKPILIFFNLTRCPYCRGALREAIVPMFRNAEWRAALEFRQVTVDDGKSLVDFDGKTIESIAFAKKRKGTFTPTVMLVDDKGQLLGDPIVGISSFDFYGAYVDALAKKAIDEMRTRK